MSARPVSIRFAASATARLEDAHASDTVAAGTEAGSVANPTSLAMFGARGS